jgi:hypothetical protein
MLVGTGRIHRIRAPEYEVQSRFSICFQTLEIERRVRAGVGTSIALSTLEHSLKSLSSPHHLTTFQEISK